MLMELLVSEAAIALPDSIVMSEPHIDKLNDNIICMYVWRDMYKYYEFTDEQTRVD